MPRPRTTALLLSAGLVAGCGGKAPAATPTTATSSGTVGATASASPTSGTTSAAGTSTSAAATTTAAARPTVRSVEIRVTGRKVRPAPGRIRLAVGERVDLVIVADVATEVHVHADPEIEARTRPGRPVVIGFTGARKGVYEVELHHPSLLLTRLVVS